ncbi:MAG: peptide chain release factor N(5)-glutamine methyltransferase [Marinilabiliaceae bacterium]|nr:peptide chain release factor N(5)-glutamine methyltransferase [Marinilabiliaceae bacterium]
MQPYSFRTALLYLTNQLGNLYNKQEYYQITKMIFEQHLKFSSIDFIVKQDEAQTDIFYDTFNKIVTRLKTGEPIQYILGITPFRNLLFEVNENVLIPRQETEELIDWIITDNYNSNYILDIGTGSGCIALSLKHELKQSIVSAWDISDKALKVAKNNAEKNHLDIIFNQFDILQINATLFKSSFDLIVSNPPYIRNSEKILMHTNVLNFEPHIALFVTDNDPLLFYRIISQKSKIMLKNGGVLFFEINEAFGMQICEILKTEGYHNIELRQDLSGKDRMIKAIFI